MKVTEDLLPGPVADVTSHTISLTAVLSPTHNMASASLPTIGSTCAELGHPLDPYPKEQKMAPLGTYINADPNAKQEETIKARNVRKHLE